MNKAAFLDRDGVINFERGDYSYHIDHFSINDGVFESLKLLQQKGYLLIIITNQGGIAKGRYTMDDVEVLHQYMLNEFEKHGISITEIYYCQHHSVVEKCLCRKPGSLMLEKAVARFNIDKQQSFFIGDNERDMLAAQGAGVQGVKVEPNESILKFCQSL